MEEPVPTLERVKQDLSKLREVARRVYESHPARSAHNEGAWTFADYLAGIDRLEAAVDEALTLPECTRERFLAEKAARNQIAQRLYYRGRIEVKTGRLGVFEKKRGEKGIHWDPTELSRAADRLAAEPLRKIYKQTEACLTD